MYSTLSTLARLCMWSVSSRAASRPMRAACAVLHLHVPCSTCMELLWPFPPQSVYARATQRQAKTQRTGERVGRGGGTFAGTEIRSRLTKQARRSGRREELRRTPPALAHSPHCSFPFAGAVCWPARPPALARDGNGGAACPISEIEKNASELRTKVLGDNAAAFRAGLRAAGIERK